MRYCARRGARPTGISLSRVQVDFARARMADERLEASVLYQDFFSYEPAERFDAISIMGVLEDISDYRLVMRRIAKWIKPGGRVYLDFAASYRRLGISPFITQHVWPGKFRMVYMPQLVKAINGAPFDIVELHNDRHNYHLWTRKGYERTTERHEESCRSPTSACGAHCACSTPGAPTSSARTRRARAPIESCSRRKVLAPGCCCAGIACRPAYAARLASRGRSDPRFTQRAYNPLCGHSTVRSPRLNALAPIACESRRMNPEMIASASMRRRSSSVRPTPRTTVSLSVRIAPCGSAAISWASACARTSADLWHNLVHQPDALGLGRADAPAGDDHLEPAREAHDQRQPSRQAIAGDDVPAPLGRAELGVLGRDAMSASIAVSSPAANA